MRLKARVDGNHGVIVDGLRAEGLTVQSLAQLGKGIPDILVGVPLVGKLFGLNFLFEIKRPGCDKTPDQIRWMVKWAGQCNIIKTIDEATMIIDNKLHDLNLQRKINEIKF